MYLRSAGQSFIGTSARPISRRMQQITVTENAHTSLSISHTSSSNMTEALIPTSTEKPSDWLEDIKSIFSRPETFIPICLATVIFIVIVIVISKAVQKCEKERDLFAEKLFNDKHYEKIDFKESEPHRIYRREIDHDTTNNDDSTAENEYEKKFIKLKWHFKAACRKNPTISQEEILKNLEQAYRYYTDNRSAYPLIRTTHFVEAWLDNINISARKILNKLQKNEASSSSDSGSDGEIEAERRRYQQSVEMIEMKTGDRSQEI